MRTIVEGKAGKKSFILINFFSSQTAVLYNKSITEERKQTKEEKEIAHVGKTDPKKKISADVQQLMGDNIVQTLGSMLDAVVFSME